MTEQKQKKCEGCGKIKFLSDFYYRNDSNRYKNDCKKCCIQKQLEYYSKNKDKCIFRIAKWAQNNKDKVNANSKRYRNNNKEKRKESCRKWAKNNKDKVLAIQRKTNKKIRSTIIGKLNHRMGNNLRISLKQNKNGRHWESLVGYSVNELKEHLENLFTEGMTWKKFLNGDIHIDHIIPKSFFKFKDTDDVEFKYCWSLNNLQPLWTEDNMKKGDKIMLWGKEINAKYYI